MLKWYVEKEKQEKLFEEVLQEEIFSRYVIYHKDINGNTLVGYDGKPVPVNHFPYELFSKTEEIFAVPVLSLKDRWKSCIKDTWNRFIMIFKPYLCR